MNAKKVICNSCFENTLKSFIPADALNFKENSEIFKKCSCQGGIKNGWISTEECGLCKMGYCDGGKYRKMCTKCQGYG